ncbi:restriction endonuclease [Rugamonas aquatica]|uniref:Restriction endonuclease type IV Mrr domain-containing protein n=1 Tax=Rugamonas aquatica TaxID=2743357 RepID=A0A6A7N656_9BURK|nr:restriction endonuclease [Rugamonas aquatica]MQA40573.1 hypothetical protein [Rugamonas aquatica]
MSAVLRWLVGASSRCCNWLRLLDRPAHRRRIRQSRKVLHALRCLDGDGRQARRLAYLRQVDPLCVEEVVLSACEAGGAPVLRNRSYSGDGGIDGRVWIRGSGWHLVQVKRYREHVALAHLQQFAALVAAQRVAGGWFVHTGRSGRALYPALRGSRVTLVSGERLLALLADGVMPARPAAPVRAQPCQGPGARPALPARVWGRRLLAVLLAGVVAVLLWRQAPPRAHAAPVLAAPAETATLRSGLAAPQAVAWVTQRLAALRQDGRYRLVVAYGSPLFPSDDALLDQARGGAALAAWVSLPPSARRPSWLVLPDADWLASAPAGSVRCQLLVSVAGDGRGSRFAVLPLRCEQALKRHWRTMGRAGPGRYVAAAPLAPQPTAAQQLLQALAPGR